MPDVPEHRADTCPHQHKIDDVHRLTSEMHTVIMGNGNPDRGMFARLVRLEAERSIARWGIPIAVSALLGGAAIVLSVLMGQ